MSHVHAFPLYTYSLFHILAIFELLWDFFDCLFLSLFFLFTLVVSIAPKRKSAPSQNPLRYKTSSLSSSFDPTPSHIWFCDEDARKEFSENFSRWGVHSERWVILADFADTDISDVIHSWFRSFTPTCMDLIIQYFSFLLAFEVRALLSHRSLLRMCSMF